MSESEQLTFQQLALSEPILKALNDVGYETPSPIQAETIPQRIVEQTQGTTMCSWRTTNMGPRLLGHIRTGCDMG